MTKRDVTGRPASASVTAEAHPATVETHNFTPRRPGRPGWTEEQFIRHYRDALETTTPPQTNDRIAANFRALNGNNIQNTGLEIPVNVNGITGGDQG